MTLCEGSEGTSIYTGALTQDRSPYTRLRHLGKFMPEHIPWREHVKIEKEVNGRLVSPKTPEPLPTSVFYPPLTQMLTDTPRLRGDPSRHSWSI